MYIINDTERLDSHIIFRHSVLSRPSPCDQTTRAVSLLPCFLPVHEMSAGGGRGLSTRVSPD